MFVLIKLIMATFTTSVDTSAGKFSAVFLGTGVSTAVPNLQHIINPAGKPCSVCHDALASGSKNRRNNVSLGLIFNDEAGAKKCVVIDVGKTMRDGCLQLLPRLGVREVHGIVLTHGHADAIFGLDDVRDLQISKPTKVTGENGEKSTGFKVMSGAMPVFLNEPTMQTVKKCFGYLTEPPVFLDEKNKVLERRIALLDFQVIDSNANFNVAGLPIRSFPVYHGGTYISLGFSIGKAGELVYISDVKIIPEETMEYLKALPRIKVFVIDVLALQGIFAHMGLDEALAVVRILNPEVTYFVGMSCSVGLHDELEAKLAEMEPNTHLAFDGLILSDFDIN